MPIYEYRCEECAHTSEEYQSIRSDPLTACPKCCSSSFHRVPSLTHSLNTPYRIPIEMHSIALSNQDDIKAFKQRNSDVPISTNPNDPLWGVPIARSRAEKLKVLRNEGFVERN